MGSWEDSEWDEKALSNFVSFLQLKVLGVKPCRTEKAPSAPPGIVQKRPPALLLFDFHHFRDLQFDDRFNNVRYTVICVEKSY